MPGPIKLVRSLETHYGYLKAGTVILPRDDTMRRRLLESNVAVEYVEVEPERQADGVVYQFVDTTPEEETDDRDDGDDGDEDNLS